MPSIETFTFSMSNLDLVTNRSCRLRGDLNLALTYNSLTKLTFEGKYNVLEISGTILANITKRVPFLEGLYLSNVNLTGDLELNMEPLKCLKKFHMTSKSITGNDIVMIKKLYFCMPLHGRDSGFLCTLKLSEPEVYNADISRLYSSRRQITFNNCCLNASTLISALEQMIWLKAVVLVDVTIAGDLEENTDSVVKYLMVLEISGTSMSDKTLYSIVSRLPSIQVLKVDRAVIQTTGFKSNMKCWRCLRELEINKISISSNFLITLLNSMPLVSDVTFCNVDVQEKMFVTTYSGTKMLKTLHLAYCDINENTFVFFIKLLACLSSIGTLVLSYPSSGQTIGSIYMNTLITVLRRTPLIEHIVLGNVQIAKVLGTFNNDLIVKYKSLETLAWINKTKGNETDGEMSLLLMLYFLPSLKELSVKNVAITCTTDMCQDLPVVSTSLKHLKLHFSELYQEPLSVKILQSLPALESLTMFNILLMENCASNVGTTTDLRKDMPFLGKSLKYLDIRFSNLYETPFNLKVLHLMPILECLILSNIPLTEDCDYKAPPIYNSLKVLCIHYTSMNQETNVVSMTLLTSVSSLENLEMCSVFTKESDRPLVEFKSLKTIDLSFSGFSKSQNALTTLATMLRKSPNLYALKVYDLGINKDLTLGDHFPLPSSQSMKVFDLREAYMCGEHLAILLRHMPALETLKLALSRTELKQLIHVPFEKLTSLEIESNHNMTNYFQALLGSMPKLEKLSLGTRNVVVKNIASKTIISTTLKTVTLSYDDDDRDYYNWRWDFEGNDDDNRSEELLESLMNYLCLMPSLENFTLRFDSTLNPFAYVNDSKIKEKSKLTSLKEFQIENWKDEMEPCQSSVIMYFLRCMPQLQQLVVKGVQLSDQLNKTHIISTPISLRACTIERCKLHGHTLLVLLASMPALEVLTLDDFEIVGDMDVDVFALCEELQQCSDINEDMRRKIRDAVILLPDSDQ